MGCLLSQMCGCDDKSDYRELEGRQRQQRIKAKERRRQRQLERRGVPSDPNSRDSHRRHDKPREEVELKTFLPPEERRCGAGDGDSCNLCKSNRHVSATSVSASENRRKQMLDAAEKRQKGQSRLEAMIRKKRKREEEMEKREWELAQMGGPNLKWQT